MSMLTGKAYAPLKAGTYQVKLASASEHKVPQGRGKQPKFYVRLEWMFDNGRMIVDNRFPEGVNSFNQAMAQMAEQFGLEEVDIPQLLNMAKTHHVTIWVEHRTTEDNRHFRNIWLHEPYNLNPNSNDSNNDEDEVL